MLTANKVIAANEVGVVEGGDESIKKSVELKTGKLLKSQKLSKSWKSAKSGRKLSKIRNSPNFNAKKIRPRFLTFKARAVFNCLWLAFTEATILKYFDSEYYI